jgi:hypothetical protein
MLPQAVPCPESLERHSPANISHITYHITCQHITEPEVNQNDDAGDLKLWIKAVRGAQLRPDCLAKEESELLGCIDPAIGDLISCHGLHMLGWKHIQPVSLTTVVLCAGNAQALEMVGQQLDSQGHVDLAQKYLLRAWRQALESEQ